MSTEITTQDCAAQTSSIYEACYQQQFDFTEQTGLLPSGFYKNCLEGEGENEECTQRQKVRGFKTVCPEFKILLECYKPALDCILDPAYGNEKTIKELKHFQKACSEIPDSELSQGFTFMMPWSLLLVFFV